MKVKEFQDKIADAINGIDELIKGGCKCFAEDSQDVMFNVPKQVQTAKGVAIVVSTPSLKRNGCASNYISVDTQLDIKCLETPSLNRSNSSHLTALDAAEIIAHALSADDFYFDSISQYGDEQRKCVVATVTFNVCIHLT